MDGWLAIERQMLVLLALVAVMATAIGWRRAWSGGSLVAGAACGALFCIWMVGVRVMVPSEVGWAMKLDWQMHFLGWHFFRHEPLHLPPGRIDGYYAPIGTSIGLIDAIPLAAFLLRPFAAFLPMPMQYLGPWVLICFVLQGVFGVLLMRLWTSHTLSQVAGALCFVLLPTLILRIGHAALTSHWLILWALYLYFRADRQDPPSIVHAALIGLAGGLINPYLATMVLAMLAAISVRSALRAQRSPRVIAGVVLAAAAGTLLGWWASGLFLVSGVKNLSDEGFRIYTMNLLSPVTPNGWSMLLPEIPLARGEQGFEGFQYFGAGLLLLIASAVVTRVVARVPTPVGVIWPMTFVCLALAAYAVGPRVTLGAAVVMDLPMPWLDYYASIYRAAGRFFWPAAYLTLTVALATVTTRLRPRVVVSLLAGIIAVQMIDLRPGHLSRRAVRLDPAWFASSHALLSPTWRAALPHYDHVVMYPPPHCAAAPIPLEPMAYLAGLHGLTINAGRVSRQDDAARWRSCASLLHQVRGGTLDVRSLYVTGEAHVPELMAAGQGRFVCEPIDGVHVCVAAQSRGQWRPSRALE